MGKKNRTKEPTPPTPPKKKLPELNVDDEVTLDTLENSDSTSSDDNQSVNDINEVENVAVEDGNGTSTGSDTPSVDEEAVEKELEKNKNTPKVVEKKPEPVPKKTYAELLKNNRKATQGMQLFKVELNSIEEVFIPDEAILPIEQLWGYCLVGCFSGKFPGLKAIQKMVDQWSIPCEILPHRKGWIVLKFWREEHRQTVLTMKAEELSIGNKKLLLKIPEKDFMWNCKSFATMPVWVKLLDVPMGFWSPLGLSHIASFLGTPLYSDGVTHTAASVYDTSMEPNPDGDYRRVNFCRVMIDMDLTVKPPVNVKVTYNGGDYIQKIEYEDMPCYCYHYDLMLFSRGDIESVTVLADALNHFSQASGLRVNPQKSSIFLAGEVKDNRQDILNLVQFPLGRLPVRYLGLPLTSQRASERDFAPLIAKVEDNICKWNTKTLSQAGRVELIRSVIQGIQSFWLQAFPIHKTVLNRITTICRSFLWGSKFSKVAWSDICKPIEEGGLGLRNSYTWNQAFLIKNLWNIACAKDTLWVKWVHAVYLQNREVWTWTPKEGDSHLFKKMSFARDLFVDKLGGSDGFHDRLQNMCENGNLNTTTVYDLLRTRNQPKPWMKFIWQTYIPPRFSFTTWLILRKRLPTKVNLSYVDMENRDCSLCHLDAEDTKHLFFACHVSAQIWNGVKEWINLDVALSTLNRAIKWLRKSHHAHSNIKKMCRLATLSTVYHIWRLRNGAYFDQIAVDVHSTIQKIKLSVYKVMYRLFPNAPLRLGM
ncbi:unnamed protein product, partial [Cuscuta campestris]